MSGNMTTALSTPPQRTGYTHVFLSQNCDLTIWISQHGIAAWTTWPFAEPEASGSMFRVARPSPSSGVKKDGIFHDIITMGRAVSGPQRAYRRLEAPLKF
ncbi:hypothetical protein AAFF_G00416350 [Aldrovandia affinis]|uniref:Uncharacterized protein n=1 Tax=Aldrovandia affinis TaxID=143900 RepID=A0AAD7WJD4_9TELE|nr:hypothetical protein AAFF_G00416350 [Aldrovandia affinis]